LEADGSRRRIGLAFRNCCAVYNNIEGDFLDGRLVRKPKAKPPPSEVLVVASLGIGACNDVQLPVVTLSLIGGI